MPAVPAAVRDYLDELDRVSRGLTRHERQDLRAQVWAEVARVARPDPSPERVAAALHRLGPPSGLVGTDPSSPPRDPVVVHLLGSSLLTLGVGGVVGLVRLWRSPTWPRLDAVPATALVAAGGVVVPLLAPGHVVAGVLLGALGAGPLVAATYLGVRMLLARRRARRGRSAYPLSAAATPIPPEGEAEPPRTGGVTPTSPDQTPCSVGPSRVHGPATRPEGQVDSKESG